jgi:hypothetical protein
MKIGAFTPPAVYEPAETINHRNAMKTLPASLRRLWRTIQMTKMLISNAVPPKTAPRSSNSLITSRVNNMNAMLITRRPAARERSKPAERTVFESANDETAESLSMVTHLILLYFIFRKVDKAGGIAIQRAKKGCICPNLDIQCPNRKERK